MAYIKMIRIMLTQAEGFDFAVHDFGSYRVAKSRNKPKKCHKDDEFCEFKNQILLIKNGKNISFSFSRNDNFKWFDRLRQEKEKKGINEEHPFLYSAFLYLSKSENGPSNYPQKTDIGVLLEEVQIEETELEAGDKYRIKLVAASSKLINS